MSDTNSLSFPNMFNVSQNTVQLIEDTASVTNRTRLLLLTDPTELHMNLDFGVGLKRYIFQYNNPNQIAMIKNKIIEQLKLHEPCADAEKTQFADGLVFTGSNDVPSAQEYNELKFTVAVATVFGDNAEVIVDDIGIPK